MIVYNKLVRDKIPEIIENQGKKLEYIKVEDSQLLELLNIKLMEEIEEYYEDGNIEELADILEVIYGILRVKNVSKDRFEEIRMEKYNSRGGFEKGFKLIRADK